MQFEQRYFVSFPTNEKVYPTEKVAVMSQRVHLMISQKIETLVKEGITKAYCAHIYAHVMKLNLRAQGKCCKLNMAAAEKILQ